MAQPASADEPHFPQALAPPGRGIAPPCGAGERHPADSAEEQAVAAEIARSPRFALRHEGGVAERRGAALERGERQGAGDEDRAASGEKRVDLRLRPCAVGPGMAKAGEKIVVEERAKNASVLGAQLGETGVEQRPGEERDDERERAAEDERRRAAPPHAPSPMRA